MSSSNCIIPFYTPFNVSFARGQGVYLYDTHGKRYLDCCAGGAANALGHNHPALVSAIEKQIKRVWHVSNMYRINETELLAEKIVSNSFADMAFFVNSGAEAVECGFKIARSYQNGIKRGERYKILTLRRAFHGRTFTACSANEPSEFLPALMPYVDWFVSTAPDIDSIRTEVEKGAVGAILVEPVQGEGGIHVLEKSLLEGLRELCDKHDILLFFDCVQCGAGRTGKFFAYEHSGVMPDICSMGKGLGCGFPIGACLITNKAGRFVLPRMHGSTCGGNPLAASVSYAAVCELMQPQLLHTVEENGKYLRAKLNALAGKYHFIDEVRGIGLMVALQFGSSVNAWDVAVMLLESGLLVAYSSCNAIRFMPPLIVSRAEIDEACEILEGNLQKL